MDDRTKVGVMFTIAMAIAVVIQFLNLAHVFEHAPTWLWVLIWAVQLLVVLPAVIAYGVVVIRDLRKRKRERASQH